MIILRILGLALIVLWLALWLAVKLTFWGIHMLVIIGLVLLIMGFARSATR